MLSTRMTEGKIEEVLEVKIDDCSLLCNISRAD